MTGKDPGRGALGLGWALQRAHEGHGLVCGDRARLCGGGEEGRGSEEAEDRWAGGF